MKKKLTDQCIISLLKNNYDIDVANLALLPFGADADALVYKAHTNDNNAYFVKVKNGQHDIASSLQFLLHDAGIKEIISPIRTLEKQPALYVDDFMLTIYLFIDGHDGFSQTLTDDQWIMLGKALKQIHAFRLPASLSSIKQETFSSEWREAIRSIYATIDQTTPSDDIASKFLASLKKHRSQIMSLVNKAETLLQEIRKQTIDFVLCHGDIHAGNILIANDSLYIVDWDEPIMAPKERDLMFIGAGVGNVWNKKREAELFYTGYSNTEINTTIIDYYRCERILQDIVEFYQLIILDDIEYENRLTNYNYFTAMFEPNGVVNIALQN